MRGALASVAVVIALLAGCTTEQGRYTVLSTKNVELSRIDLKHMPVAKDVSASDGRLWFLFIPFGHAPQIDVSVDRVLADGKGDFLTSAHVTSFWWTCLLFSWESVTTEGDVGQSSGKGAREVVPANENDAPSH